MCSYDPVNLINPGLSNNSINNTYYKYTINLLLQGADNLPGSGPFSYENSTFLCFQILPHILHRYSLEAERLGFEEDHT